MMDDPTPRPPGQTGEEGAARPAGLQRGAVGLAGDFIGAISDVAPTLDVGLTLAAFVIAVGLAGPSSILITGVAMLCVATGYARLNRAEPNAAAGVPWLRRIMPAFGFAMGLLVILTITFILISNVSLMGSTILSLFNSSLTSNAFVVWVVGAAVLFLTVVIAVFGLRVQIRFQGVIVILEYAIVIICAAAILWAHANGRLSNAPHPSLSWLSPTSGSGGISAGIVLGVFTLGGWENPIYLAEEQRNARRDPGRAAYLGIIWGAIFIAFLLFAFQSAAPASEMVKHGGNVLGFATGLVLPQPWPTLIDLALISSLVGGIQATASDGARTAFGMARAVVAGVLYLVKDFPRLEAAKRGRVWERFSGGELSGKSATIIGLGAVGRPVGLALHQLGVTVTGVSRRAGRPAPPGFAAVTPIDHLDEAISGADLLVVCCPLTSETRGLVGHRQLSLLRPGAIVTNIARGPVIDQTALLAALEGGHLGGAVLDVFDEEPLPAGSRFWTLPNVLVSPHSASTATDENARLVQLFTDNLRRFLDGLPLLNVFCADRGY